MAVCACTCWCLYSVIMYLFKYVFYFIDTVMHVDVDVWLMRAIGLCNCPVVRNETEGDPSTQIMLYMYIHMYMMPSRSADYTPVSLPTPRCTGQDMHSVAGGRDMGTGSR